MQLALHLSRVRMAGPRPATPGRCARSWPMLRDGGVRAVSPNGVLGDPTRGQRRTKGPALLDELAAELDHAVDQWLGSSAALSR